MTVFLLALLCFFAGTLVGVLALELFPQDKNVIGSLSFFLTLSAAIALGLYLLTP